MLDWFSMMVFVPFSDYKKIDEDEGCGMPIVC